MQLNAISTQINDRLATAQAFISGEVEGLELWLNLKLNQDLPLATRFKNGWNRTQPLRNAIVQITLTIVGLLLMGLDRLREFIVVALEPKAEKTAVVSVIRKARIQQLKAKAKIRCYRRRWDRVRSTMVNQYSVLDATARSNAAKFLQVCSDANHRARSLQPGK